jgi:hypothetical protein
MSLWLKSKLGIFPDLEISTLSFSLSPIGTSLSGIFGMLDKILSNSDLICFCSFVIVSSSFDISFDLLNKLSSLDLEISFFHSQEPLFFEYIFLFVSSNSLILSISTSIFRLFN